MAAIPVNPFCWSKSAKHDVTLTSLTADLLESGTDLDEALVLSAESGTDLAEALVLPAESGTDLAEALVLSAESGTDLAEALVLSAESGTDLAEALVLSAESGTDLAEALVLSAESGTDLAEALVLSAESGTDLAEALVLSAESGTDLAEALVLSAESGTDLAEALVLSAESVAGSDLAELLQIDHVEGADVVLATLQVAPPVALVPEPGTQGERGAGQSQGPAHCGPTFRAESPSMHTEDIELCAIASDDTGQRNGPASQHLCAAAIRSARMTCSPSTRRNRRGSSGHCRITPTENRYISHR